jgi:DNA-binding transcriptional regulator YhcF (GntR family)
VLQAMIVMNHINIDKAYVKLQQEKVLATIRKRTNNDFIYSDKFEEMVDIFVEDLIKDLISIRESIK